MCKPNMFSNRAHDVACTRARSNTQRRRETTLNGSRLELGRPSRPATHRVQAVGGPFWQRRVCSATLKLKQLGRGLATVGARLADDGDTSEAASCSPCHRVSAARAAYLGAPAGEHVRGGRRSADAATLQHRRQLAGPAGGVGQSTVGFRRGLLCSGIL